MQSIPTSFVHAAAAAAFGGLAMLRHSEDNFTKAFTAAQKEAAFAVAPPPHGAVPDNCPENWKAPEWEAWIKQCEHMKLVATNLCARSEITLEREEVLLKSVQNEERQELMQGGCKQQ